MISHIYAFEKHCENPDFSYADNQFPTIFGKIIDDTCSLEEGSKGNIDQIELWLYGRFQDSGSFAVLDAHIIGSALRGQFARADVDVFILTDTTVASDIRESLPIIDDIKQEFLLEFGRPLHVIALSSLEKQEYYDFLEILSRKRRIEKF